MPIISHYAIPSPETPNGLAPLVVTEDNNGSLGVEQSEKACRNPMVGLSLPAAR